MNLSSDCAVTWRASTRVIIIITTTETSTSKAKILRSATTIPLLGHFLSLYFYLSLSLSLPLNLNLFLYISHLNPSSDYASFASSLIRSLKHRHTLTSKQTANHHLLQEVVSHKPTHKQTYRIKRTNRLIER